jgi:hypothetical protein
MVFTPRRTERNPHKIAVSRAYHGSRFVAAIPMQ